MRSPEPREAHAEKAEYDMAKADVEAAIRRNPKSSDAYAVRSIINGKTGDIEKAIADGSEAIRLNPKSAKAYYCRGRANAKNRADNMAIADFTECYPA